MNVLFISHRFPYPPNKGDKIRSFHILKHLAERHEVYVATLMDEPEDAHHAPTLASFVKELHYDTIRPKTKKICSSLALLRKKPISVAYFYSRELQRRVDDLLDRVPMDAVFCFSSPTAEYVFRSRHQAGKMRGLHRIMDLVDVDSLKWEQYAQKNHGPMRPVYALESKYLHQFENRIAEEFHHVLLVSESERALFSQRVAAAQSHAVSNGVDLEYFSPKAPSDSSRNGPRLTFTGVMDYWPNVEGVEWFLREVFPRLQSVLPHITFFIVGRRPAPSLRRLAENIPGVRVTGYVEDVRTYMADADVCIAPLRVARGIQNKVLEAMAMGKPVVCTPEALEGIQAVPERDAIQADGASGFAEAILQLLKDPVRRRNVGASARSFVEENFSWQKNLTALDVLIQTPVR